MISNSENPAPEKPRSRILHAVQTGTLSVIAASLSTVACLGDPLCAGTDITCNPAATLLYLPACNGTVQAVFRSDRDGNQEIYSRDLAASDTAPQRLTDVTQTDAQPEWTAGGAGVVFMSQRDGNQEIYRMDADGTNPTRLTNNPSLDITPRASLLDGRIVFTSQRDGNREIYVMDADGANPTRLTNSPGDDDTPVWALADSLILFTSDRTGDDELFAMQADGSNVQQLTNSPGLDRNAKWSETRQQIVFSSDRSGTELIYAMDLDGGNLTQLTTFESSQPSPAPCDRRLLIRSSANPQGMNPDLDDEILLLDPDTGEIENITNDPATDVQPDWTGN